MTKSTLNVRMDAELKEKFALLCAESGIDMSTAVNLFAATCIKRGSIPFELLMSNQEYQRYRRLTAYMSYLEGEDAKASQHPSSPSPDILVNDMLIETKK